MNEKRQRRCRGFSLIEVLVSALILALGLVAISQLYMAAVWTSQKAQYVTTATQEAQFLMEKVRDIGFNRLATVTTSDGFITTSSDAVPLFDAAEGYRPLSDTTALGVETDVPGLPDGVATVAFDRYNNYPNLLQVTIGVTWAGAQRSQSDVRIVTLVANGAR